MQPDEAVKAPQPQEAARAKIGELLADRGLVTQDDIEQALRLQRETGILFGQALMRIGAVTEEVLLDTLSGQLGWPVYTSHQQQSVGEESVRQAASALGVNLSWIYERSAVIWSDGDDSPWINVIASNPLSPELRETLDQLTPAAGKEGQTLSFRYWLAPSAGIEAGVDLLRRLDGKSGGQSGADDDDWGDDSARLRELAEEAPVIDFVNAMFAAALKDRASDIHVEPYEASFQVRFRIDGILHQKQTHARRRFDAIASRIKLMSGMDIGERRLPQDGRQSIRFAGEDIDMRVSALPSVWGESIVIRLLKKNAQLPDFAGLGYSGHARTILNRLLAKPNGIVLVTGPTGSGKTTTLYRAIEQINDGERKIITIEDPVEYDVAAVTQVQVKSDIGYSFAKGLRAVLRQDPDVILVGEIRDGETATIAAQAALTGHLVLSTLHTNSALAAVSRLSDIGLDPFLISAVLRGVAAQRLVRRVCNACSSPIEHAEAERQARLCQSDGAPAVLFEGAPANWRTAQGCSACSGTGYSGRLAVVEIAEMTDEMADHIRLSKSEDALILLAREQGFATLFEDALAKARHGLTTFEEVMRVFGTGSLEQ